MIKFSIICPTYNAQKHLKKAVESIFKQSYQNWELVLIDDGSIDGSGTLCDFFASLDKRTKVLHQSNHGQSVARLKGLETCSGDYVLFLDSDDQYEPNALELLVSELKSNGADAILYNAKKKSTKECVDVYVLNEKAILRDKNSILKECFANRTAGYFWTYCFKRNLFELSSEAKEKFSRIKYSEDVYLIYRIFSQNVESLIILPESLYVYNTNDDSITHTQTAVKVKDRFNVFDEVYSDLFKNYGMYPIKSIKANIGWTYLSFLNRAAKEYDYPVFREECLKIRESFIYKKINSFKKDRFNFLIHFLFKIRMYKKAYSIIRKH